MLWYYYRETVELALRAERSGVAWITIHGRTIKQRAEPASLEAIRLVRDRGHVTITWSYKGETILRSRRVWVYLWLPMVIFAVKRM